MIYLYNETENKLGKAAKASKKPVSKWIATIYKEKVATEWAENITKLAGSWKDDFPSLEEIRAIQDIDIKGEDF